MKQESSSRLCRSCGLCCLGVFHTSIAIQAEDAAFVARYPGVIVTDQEGNRTFNQPCPAHKGECTVYDIRPQTCRGHKCDLLLDMEKELATPDYCLDTVARTRLLLEELRSELASAFAGRDVAIPRPNLANVEQQLKQAYGDTCDMSRQFPLLSLKLAAFHLLWKRFYSGRHKQQSTV